MYTRILYIIYHVRFIPIYLPTKKINVKTPICLPTSLGRGKASVKIEIHTVQKPLLIAAKGGGGGRRDTAEKQSHVCVTNGAVG